MTNGLVFLVVIISRREALEMKSCGKMEGNGRNAGTNTVMVFSFFYGGDGACSASDER